MFISVQTLDVKLDKLVKTCEDFIETVGRMLDNGEIDKKYHDEVIAKKVDFINRHKKKNNIIQFPKVESEVS